MNDADSARMPGEPARFRSAPARHPPVLPVSVTPRFLTSCSGRTGLGPTAYSRCCRGEMLIVHANHIDQVVPAAELGAASSGDHG